MRDVSPIEKVVLEKESKKFPVLIFCENYRKPKVMFRERGFCFIMYYEDWKKYLVK